MRLYIGDAAVADEIVQEAFIRLCRDWHSLSAEQNRVGWVYTVAYNLARSRFRRQRARQRAYRRAELHAASAQDARNNMPDTADIVAVRDAVQSLDDDLRAIVVLRYYAGLSVNETADALDIAEGTVKTRTRKALAVLRSAGLHAPDDATPATRTDLAVTWKDESDLPMEGAAT